MNILSFLKRIFTPKVDYKKLYSSVWNKNKSNYLRSKVKGKKTIHWYEKRGKGSYFDKKLTNSIKYRSPGFDEDIPEEYKKQEAMNRLSFLKTIGVGIAAAVITPKVIADIKPKNNLIPKGNFIEGCDSYKRNLTPEEIIKIWRQTGDILYIPKREGFGINAVFHEGERKWIGICEEDGNLLCKPL